jgi:hypothetical protein
MIRPDKHMDLNFSVIRAGALIIEELQAAEYILFDELLDALIRKTDERVKSVFIPTLSFLFLLGKIQYCKKKDSFKLVKKQ